MKSQQSTSTVLPSLSEAAPHIPSLFSNAHRAETIRQLQQSGYPVAEEKLPGFQEGALAFGLEGEGMPWVAERGIAVHQVYGEYLTTVDPCMMANVSLQTVVAQARRMGHPVVGAPVASATRPDGVGVYLPQTRPTPLANLVELKPKGTALSGGGPAQLVGYQKALEGCGLQTSLMPPTSPLANTVLPVPGYGEVEFEGIQDGIVGYTQLRRPPQTVPELAPQEAPEKQKAPHEVPFWEHIQQLAEAVEVSLNVAMTLILLLVVIVILALMVPLPPPVPV